MRNSILRLCFPLFIILGFFENCLCNNNDDCYAYKSFYSCDLFADRYLSCKDFGGSQFYGVNFTNSDLWHCRFSFADFNIDLKKGRTTFDGTNLEGSRFKYADCRNVSFKKSNIMNAWLWYGDFRGADFTNADLTDSIVFHWKIGFKGKDKTIVKGANCKGVWGMTNKEKKYFRRNGAINVPDDCDEQEDRLKFKEAMDKLNKEFGFWSLPKDLLMGVFEAPKLFLEIAISLPKQFLDFILEYPKSVLDLVRESPEMFLNFFR